MRLTLALLITLIVAPSQAWAGYRYLAGFITFGASSGTLGGKLSIQGLPGATDGKDGSNWDIPLNQSSKLFHVATYKIDGRDGWNAADGFYSVDSRPELLAGQTLTEDIFVWAAPSTPTQGIIFSAGWEVYGSSAVTGTLKLISVPSGITYDGPTEWTTPMHVTLPFYSTTNGLTGYHFQVVMSAVPEPSSLLALLAGLGGFGAVLRKSRRG